MSPRVGIEEDANKHRQRVIDDRRDPRRDPPSRDRIAADSSRSRSRDSVFTESQRTRSTSKVRPDAPRYVGSGQYGDTPISQAVSSAPARGQYELQSGIVQHAHTPDRLANLSSRTAGLAINKGPDREGRAECSYFDSIEAEQTFSAENSNTRVRTVITKGPKSQITDVALFKAGIEAEEMIKGTANVSEPFDPSFRKCAKPERYFTVGRVFHMLWTDPPGSDPTYEHETVKSSKPSRSISATTSEVRCFVVIRPGKNYCSALPIVTYGGRGVASRQVIKHHHATISTSPKGPGCEGDENPRPGELGMLNLHVMVEPDHRAAKLNRMSRIDFGHVCSIEHEVNVKPFGTVSAESGEKLSRCFREVCTSIVAQRAGPGSQQSSSTDGNIDGRQARLREMMRLEQIQRIKLTREEEALMRSQRERTKGDGPESSRKSSDRARKVSDDQPEENDSDDPDNEDDDDEKEDDDNDDHDHDYKDKSRVQANQRANKEDEDSQSDDTKDDRLEERLSPQYAILRLYKSLRDRDMEDEDALRLTLRMSVSKGYTLEQAQRALATISRGRGRASNSPRRLEGVRRVDSGTQDPVVVEFRTLCTNGRSPRDALRYMSQTGRYTAEQLGDLISTIRSSG